MSMQEIKQALVELTPAQRREIAELLNSLSQDEWDVELVADANAGRLDSLIQQALESDIQNQTKPLDALLKNNR